MILAGTVLDIHKNPLWGVIVYAFYAPQLGSMRGWLRVGSCATDSQGDFQITTKNGTLAPVTLKYCLNGDFAKFFEGKSIDDCILYTEDQLDLQLVVE